MKIDSIINTKVGLILGIVVTMSFAFLARFFYTYTINDSEIEYYEAKVSEKLPYDLGYIGDVTFVYNTNDDIVYICDVKEDNVSIASLKENLDETRKNCKLDLLYNTDSANCIFDILNKYNKGIRVVYKGRMESVEVRFSPDEVRAMSCGKEEPQKLAYEYLESYVIDKNASCPVAVSDKNSLVEMKLDKKSFYSYHTVDESNVLTIDSLMKNNSFSDVINRSQYPDAKSVSRRVAIAGLDIKLIYTSAQTGKQKTYSFTNSDVVKTLMGKYF